MRFLSSPVEESISSLRAKNEALRLKVSQQEFSPEQVEEIRRAAETWREKIADATKQKQEVSSRLAATLAAIDAKATAIDRMLERYHASLLQLELLPASAPLAGGVDFRVSLEHVEDASSVTTRDVQQYQRQLLGNTVLGRLETVLEEYVRAVGKAVLSFREEMVKFDVGVGGGCEVGQAAEEGDGAAAAADGHRGAERAVRAAAGAARPAGVCRSGGDVACSGARTRSRRARRTSSGRGCGWWRRRWRRRRCRETWRR